MPNPSTSHSPSQTAKDINSLSTFLSSSPSPFLFHIPPHPQLTPSTTTLIIAPSAILHQANTIFTHLQTLSQSQPHPLKTLILTGGQGHSTTHLYTAIINSPQYHTLPTLIGRPTPDLNGLSEARLWYLLFLHFHDGAAVIKSWNNGAGLRVLVEERSTNCGANAAFSREMLEGHGVYLGEGEVGDDVVIVQDPTMALRTRASFERVYLRRVEARRVRFWCWCVFVPVVRVDDGGGIVWDEERMEGVHVDGLWEMKRFYGLLLGEITRLRDDERGYGPKGKGFIVHVDVSEEIERAWERLSQALEFQR